MEMLPRPLYSERREWQRVSVGSRVVVSVEGHYAPRLRQREGVNSDRGASRQADTDHHGGSDAQAWPGTFDLKPCPPEEGHIGRLEGYPDTLSSFPMV